MDAMVQDIRYAIRSLWKSPGFTAVAVLTLALAISANTAVFSVLYALVLQPVAADDPSRLAAISVTDARNHQAAFIYVETFKAFSALQHAFSHLSMYSGGAILRVEAHSLGVDAGVEGVSADYFAWVGVRAIDGRLLSDGDQSLADAANPVVVISERLRQRLFSRGNTAVGDTLTVSGKPLTIVGVLQPEFSGLDVDSGTEMWVPLAVLREVSGDVRQPVRARNLVGRLAPGVTLAQATAETEARWPAIQAATVPPLLPETEQRTQRTLTVGVESIATGFSIVRRQYGPSLTVLIALTAVLLLIGCVNVSGLLLARAMRRHQQVAVRLALGASYGRIAQHLLVEALLIVGAGFLVAVPLAWWATRSLTGMMSIARVTPFLRTLTPNLRVLGVSTLISAAAGVLIAMLPTWRSMQVPVTSALRRGRSIVGSMGRTGVVLLVGQVTLSMVLAVGAGLFARSLAHLRANEAGFRHRPILWTRIWRVPGDRATLDRPYWQELMRQLAAIRGVDSVAASYYFPSYLSFPGALVTNDYARVNDSAVTVAALTELVSPGFFEMFGIPRLSGRDFAWSDDVRAPDVAVLSDTAARHLFPAGGAVGQHLRVTARGKPTDVEVVGIVADATIGLVRDAHPVVVFRPMLQDLTRASVPDVHVRVTGDMSAVRTEYVRVVQGLGHHYVRGLFTLDGYLDYALLQERLLAGIAVYAAALAVLLGCIGIYGLLAYSATVRVPEIGVRMALGATRAEVIHLIVRDGLIVVGVGVLLGVPCALAAGRLVQAQLYGLTPSDPATLVAAAIAFVLTGFVAALLPAMRAARIDPMVALRAE